MKKWRRQSLTETCRQRDPQRAVWHWAKSFRESESGRFLKESLGEVRQQDQRGRTGISVWQRDVDGEGSRRRAGAVRLPPRLGVLIKLSLVICRDNGQWKYHCDLESHCKHWVCILLSIYLCACLFMWRLMHIIPIGVRVKAAFVKPTVGFSSTWLNIFLMLSKLCDYVTVTETAHPTKSCFCFFYMSHNENCN